MRTLAAVIGAVSIMAGSALAQTSSGSSGGAGGAPSSGATSSPSGSAPAPTISPSAPAPGVILPNNLPAPSSSSPGAPGAPTGAAGQNPAAPLPPGNSPSTTGSITTPNSAAPTAIAPSIPTNPNVGQSTGGPGRRIGATGGGGGKTIEDCMALWDAKTHMTKEEWRRTCRRTLNGAELPAEN